MANVKWQEGQARRRKDLRSSRHRPQTRRAGVLRCFHMTGHGEKFGREKEEAIAALLTQPSVEHAARSIGVSTRTLLRWLKVPEFQTAYRQARRAAFSQSVARLQQASGAAVSTLLKVMVDQATPAS